ncbi:hypothetical protein N9924_00655 [bacterium]|nr:hypothetical protein [bacterium]
MKNLEILVGADPEVFMKREGKKFFQSAHGEVPGTKDEPFVVDKGAVQVDGMALEFNIDPAKNREEFVDNLQAVMQQLGAMVPDYELIAQPTATFTKAHMKKQPPEALDLGCEPDFNAWRNGAVNPRPDGAVNFRTGAGHIHIGWTKDVDIADPTHMEACIWVTRQLDYYLGIPSLQFDKDTKRRKLYGKAGAFRPKSYGVEYRVLSNAWLRSPEMMNWVYDRVDQAIKAMMKGKYAFTRFGDRAQEMIDSGNSRDVLHYCHYLDIPQAPGV